MYLLFYPEEEEFLRFRDFRGKFVGEGETGGTSLSFPKLGRGPEIRGGYYFGTREEDPACSGGSPTLTQFRTRPGCPRLPDPTNFEAFQTTAFLERE